MKRVHFSGADSRDDQKWSYPVRRGTKLKRTKGDSLRMTWLPRKCSLASLEDKIIGIL
ncbi:hypothetical protein [Hahella ganghwensis]|uniref:hypothetical protein n=1 Tax=Hahella ganghwensis TaxID=286420 RepID=UPI00037E3434|nr:hypothetical protein [Hahella ganghwensis]